MYDPPSSRLLHDARRVVLTTHHGLFCYEYLFLNWRWWASTRGALGVYYRSQWDGREYVSDRVKNSDVLLVLRNT